MSPRSLMRRVQALGATFVALLIVTPLGIAFASVIVAVGIVRQRYGLLASTLAASALAGLLAPVQFGFVLLPLAALVIGGIAGLGIMLGRSYWRIVTIATAGLWVVLSIALIDMRDVAAEAAAQLQMDGPDAAQFTQAQQNMLSMFDWWFDHWAETAVGVAFVNALYAAVVVMSLTAWWLRRSGGVFQLSGAFKDMRVPDWVVWVLIATAVLWYVDQQSPADWMRIASWNAGLALFGLYWLNGLSIAAYAVAAFKPNPFMLAALTLAAFFLGILPLLTVPGLFDTWADFRRKLDELLAARQLREESGDDSF